MRVTCEWKKMFGKVWNPCRKILADVKGTIVSNKEGEIAVKDLKEVVLKCPGCGNKTVIKRID